MITDSFTIVIESLIIKIFLNSEQRMTIQSVTIQLPETLYRRVARRAKRVANSLEQELVAVVASGLSRQEELPSITVDVLTQLELMSVDELLQAAQTTVSRADDERMQTLADKQQASGLDAGEEKEAQELLQRADHVMLIRAKTAAILYKRGYDVTTLYTDSSTQ